MSDKETLSIYVDSRIKEKLEERAEDENRSMSREAEEILKEKLLVEERTQEIGVEQRIENMVAEAKHELRELPNALREIQAKQGVYTIALWELLKYSGESSDTKRKKALSTGSRRLRNDLQAIFGEEFTEIEKELENLQDTENQQDHNDNQDDPMEEFL